MKSLLLIKPKLIATYLPVLFFLFPPCLIAQQKNSPDTNSVKLTIHLRGVYDSKISILGITPAGIMKEFVLASGIKSGETAKLVIPAEKLPGEFVIRFDYREKQESTPYPSEKYIMASNQDLELWVSPMYCNNEDSTRFQAGERENAAFVRFSSENGRKREKLGLLQQFLMNYDEPESKFYQQGIGEYENRRQAYNQWIDTCIEHDKALFISSLYRFQYVPGVSWEGTETDRILSLIDHYFDGIDFNDIAITKTRQINDWMNSYVNLYGQLSTTEALRDSLIPLAATTAIEKTKKGNPSVYGWMVDYFYRGFESNNIPAGMKVLQPYLDDPNCLTSKRQEIERRLRGMETLVKGTKAPDFGLREPKGTLFRLYDFEPPAPYILLFFWSADCSHCVETVQALYPMIQQPEYSQKVSVVTISLDETEAEIKAWDEKIHDLSGWIHLRAEEGVRSKVANDYFILATPVMILLDPKTKEIVAMPGTPNELIHAIK